MSIFILIIVAAIAFWVIKSGMERSALKQAARDSFRAEHAGWDLYLAPFNEAVVAINHDDRAIVLGTTSAHKKYAWSSIASVDVIRDGTSITSTNRGSQLVGAAVGEVLLGPLGLLIGGVTGSKRTVQKVSQIALKIIVDDRVTPIYTVEFLRIPHPGADPRNKLVKDAAQRAEHIHALLVNAIRNCSIQAVTRAPQVSQRSVAEQIDQLWQLKDAGALTETEFTEQKARLLARNDLSARAS